MNTAAPLVKKITSAPEQVASSLTNPEFYMELMCIGLSLALAWLLTVLIEKRLSTYLEKNPPRHFSPALVLGALKLLPPLLAIVYLGVLLPFIENYVKGDLIDSTMKLCLAYLMARAILLLVRTKAIAYFIASIVMLIGILRASGVMHDTLDYLRSIQFEVGKVKLNALNLIHGIVILIVVFWLAGLLSNSLETNLRKRSTLNYNTRELIVKFFKLFVYFIAFMITLSAMGVDLTAFAVFGGALGVGIGLGLQKLTANFVSGITLLMEKSVKIGDLLEVGGTTGWVRQLNIRYALIETPDGRELLIPNEELISSRVTNWTYSNDQARIDVKVVLDNSTNVQLAIKLMVEAAQEYSKALKTPAPTCQLREFTDSGLSFTLSFWIPDVREGRSGPQSEVMVAMIEKFRKNGIQFPQGTPAVVVNQTVPQQAALKAPN